MSNFPATRKGRCRIGTVLCALVVAAGIGPSCTMPRVPECPLVPCEVLATVRHARTPPPSAGLALTDARALMRSHNPKIRAARADYRTAQTVACTRTPYPNPELAIGPLLLGGFDVLDATWGLEAALGWTVLLTDTRTLTDHVNAVRAQAALADLAAVERSEYLSLRRAYVQVQQEIAIREAREALAAAARESAEMGQKAVDAGSSTTLDVNLLLLEAAEIQSEFLATEEELANMRGDLGVHLGLAALDPGAPGPIELPVLPNRIPSGTELEHLVIAHNPALAALRAAYLVAEKELRLEVAAAVPQLGMGVAYEREGGNKLGLPLGIELPIFDRNQPAIARATQERAAVRDRYVAALTDILANVERARARLLVRQQRLALYEAQIAPAEETIALAESSLGVTESFNMLRYLEVLRATRRVRVEELTSRALVYEGWAELEQACGAPLLRFGSEIAALPAAAKQEKE